MLQLCYSYVTGMLQLCYSYVLYYILSIVYQQNTFRDCHKEKFTERYMGTCLFCFVYMGTSLSLCYINPYPANVEYRVSS